MKGNNGTESSSCFNSLNFIAKQRGHEAVTNVDIKAYEHLQAFGGPDFIAKQRGKSRKI